MNEKEDEQRQREEKPTLPLLQQVLSIDWCSIAGSILRSNPLITSTVTGTIDIPTFVLCALWRTRLIARPISKALLLLALVHASRLVLYTLSLALSPSTRCKRRSAEN